MRLDFVLQPWQLLVLIVAAWLNRQQQAQIEFLNSQLRIVLEVKGSKRFLLTDDGRRASPSWERPSAARCSKG